MTPGVVPSDRNDRRRQVVLVRVGGYAMTDVGGSLVNLPRHVLHLAAAAHAFRGRVELLHPYLMCTTNCDPDPRIELETVYGHTHA